MKYVANIFLWLFGSAWIKSNALRLAICIVQNFTNYHSNKG